MCRVGVDGSTLPAHLRFVTRLKVKGGSRVGQQRTAVKPHPTHSFPTAANPLMKVNGKELTSGEV